MSAKVHTHSYFKDEPWFVVGWCTPPPSYAEATKMAPSSRSASPAPPSPTSLLSSPDLPPPTLSPPQAPPSAPRPHIFTAPFFCRKCCVGGMYTTTGSDNVQLCRWCNDGARAVRVAKGKDENFVRFWCRPCNTVWYVTAFRFTPRKCKQCRTPCFPRFWNVKMPEATGAGPGL